MLVKLGLWRVRRGTRDKPIPDKHDPQGLLLLPRLGTFQAVKAF
jgi:hypothetical protein